MSATYAMVALVERPSLVSSTAAARVLGVHPGTLWRWARAGIVTPAATTAGGHLRWRLPELRAQVEAARARAAADRGVPHDASAS